jgi:hypothetical protein
MSPILLKDAHARNLEIKEIVLLSAAPNKLVPQLCSSRRYHCGSKWIATLEV